MKLLRDIQRINSLLFMQAQLILQKIQSVLMSIKKNDLQISEIEEEKICDRYDLDSLEFMQFISALENTFDIEFESDATYEELNDVDYLIKEIRKKNTSDYLECYPL